MQHGKRYKKLHFHRKTDTKSENSSQNIRFFYLFIIPLRFQIKNNKIESITINNSELKTYLEDSSKLNTQKSSIKLYLTKSKNNVTIY